MACNGMLGHALGEVATSNQDVDVVGTCLTSTLPKHYPTTVLDVCDPSSVISIIEKVKPDFVVNCSGITDLELCEARPDIAKAVHIDGTENLVKACRIAGAKFVYISTDSVFDGISGGYSEDSIPNPVNEYSRTKLEGEKVVGSDDLVIRTSIYGWKVSGRLSLVESILENLSRNKPFTGYNDYYFTPVYTRTLSEIILRMLDRGMKGTYNIASSERITKYAFAQKVAEIFMLDRNLVIKGSSNSVRSEIKRPRDLSLVSKKLLDAGFFPISISEDLSRMKEDRNIFGRGSTPLGKGRL